MGLKQNIVVVNEFSTKTASGGTRGGTPGAYVERYMARADAVEDLTPVRLDDNDAYVRRYMMRREATETFDTVSGVKQGITDAQKMGGIAFGSTGKGDMGDISLSNRKVKRMSREIQDNFDNGKTVMKTVVSFELPYLKEMGVVPKGFEPRRKGDYRGNVDQMKLRLAIMEGMDKMSRDFDDLEWVGVIQVDTMHVHCHLCMVDKGRGRLTREGQQRGKLSEHDMRVLRRGIDNSLDDMQPVKMMASNISYDRRNARCFIKKFTHEAMAMNGPTQFLLACLPEDRRLWRAGTNRKEMKKANAIVRDYVEQVLAQPDSGYDKALHEIDAYATARRDREDLSGQQYRQLVDQGRERLITDCMNGVYAMLREVKPEQMTTQTPMLDVMSMDYQQMANDAMSDPMMEFGFRLRSYSSRLEHHKKERQKYHDARVQYEEARDKGQVSVDSKPLYDFYAEEEEYNAMLMAKYQYFLNFLPPDDEYEDDFKELMDYRGRIRRMDSMINDPSMKRRSADSAEDYGRRVYDMHGGRFAVVAPGVLDSRLDDMIGTYHTMVDDFAYKLSEYGLSFESDEDSARVVRHPPYRFDDVKALDIHHLTYDFPYDADVSKVNIDMFKRCAERRYQTFKAAETYLVNSGQGDYVAEMPKTDVEVMKAMADSYADGNGVLASNKGGSGAKRHRSRTTSLDVNLEESMKLAVKMTMQSLEMERGE